MVECEEVLFSFGGWIRRRRKALDLTQTALAQRVGCAVVTIRKIEADSMRPSREIADRLALCLDIPISDRNTFIETARAERSVDRLGSPQTDINIKPPMRSAPTAPLGELSSGASVFQIPYPQSTLFVGRQHDLERLAALLDSNETIAVVPAITGTGGIGKTMLAAEFAHRHRDRFEGGVFWLNMEDPEGVASQVAACAGPGGLQLAGYTAWTFEQQIAATRAAWQQPDRRLLILDNLEDPKLLHWRPSSGGCRVLITTRRASWTTRSGVRALPLDTLTRVDSLHLLLTPRYGPDLPNDPHADAICEALGDLPLALALAGAYLEHYPSMTLADYAAQITSNPVAHESLNAVLEEGLPTAHASSIVATFMLSYQRLKSDDPTDALACTLLHRAACCAPVAIPRKLLAYTDAAEQEAAIYQRNIDVALHRLLVVGLLDDLGSAGVRMHRLLATFARSVTPDPDREQQWVTQMLTALLLQIIEAGYPQLGLPYLEHARYSASAVIDDTTLAGLLNNLGGLLHKMGDLAGARPYLERALGIREQLLGLEHSDTAQSLNDLGCLLHKMGDLAGARPYLEHALDIWERVLGTDHPNTAQSLNNLGYLLQEMGDLMGARPYYLRALDINERVLKADHPRTALSLVYLGYLLYAQGDMTGARPYLERALDIRERVLGTDHPDTAESLNNLGVLLCQQGDLVGAQPHFQRALDIYERTLGADHPNTALILNSLGHLLRTQGDLTGARPYLERALDIGERVLGLDHPDTALILNNLGYLLRAQGDLIGARPYLQRALDIYERTLGADHPNTARSLNNLGSLLQDMGDLTAARSYLERALDIREQVLGLDHPDAAISLNSLGSLLQAVDDLVGARFYFQRALDIREQVLGLDHPDTAQSLNNLGSLLQAMCDLTAAHPYFERALAICERTLGANHPDTAQSLNNLGSLLQAMGNLMGAQPYLECALDIRKRVLGLDHPDTAQSLNNLGSLLRMQGDLAGARPYYQRALTISERILGLNHPRTSTIRENLNTLDSSQHSL